MAMEAAQRNKEELLRHLQTNNVEYDLYEHPPVLTVEEQAKHVGHLGAGLSKNLFLKDKKGRLVLISALASTKIDLKNMAVRLGVGKGGLRMAPEETLSATLQVPLGCVTPFALFQETSRQVGLLLDVGFRSNAKNLFHPLSNDATIGVTPGGLESFLASVGREANYVDLEAEVVIDRDHGPDLAPYLPKETVPSNTEPLQATEDGTREGQAASEGSQRKSTPPVPKEAAGEKGGKEGGGKGGKGEKGGGREKEGERVIVGDDVSACAVKALSHVFAALDSEVGEKRAETEAANKESRERLQQLLTPQLEHLLVMFKNAAYSQGFAAARAGPVLGRR